MLFIIGNHLVLSDNMLKHDKVLYSHVIDQQSHERIQVMNVLNSISIGTKNLILLVLEKFSGKLLLMIDVVLLIKHDDIIFTLLNMIFDMLHIGHTYDVHTCINRNGAIESLLCYSKVCGFENNMYGFVLPEGIRLLRGLNLSLSTQKASAF